MKNLFKNPMVQKFIFYALLIVFAIVAFKLIFYSWIPEHHHPTAKEKFEKFCDKITFDLMDKIAETKDKETQEKLAKELNEWYRLKDSIDFD